MRYIIILFLSFFAFFVGRAVGQTGVTPATIEKLVHHLVEEPDRYDRGVARQQLAKYGALSPELVLERLPEQVRDPEIQASLTTLRNEIAWGHVRHQAQELAGEDKVLKAVNEKLFSNYLRHVFFFIEPAELFADPFDCFPRRSVQQDMRTALATAKTSERDVRADLMAIFLEVPNPRLREAAIWNLARMEDSDPVRINPLLASKLEDKARSVAHAAGYELSRLNHLLSASEQETYAADRGDLHRLATAWWKKQEAR